MPYRCLKLLKNLAVGETLLYLLPAENNMLLKTRSRRAYSLIYHQIIEVKQKRVE